MNWPVFLFLIFSSTLQAGSLSDFLGDMWHRYRWAVHGTSCENLEKIIVEGKIRSGSSLGKNNYIEKEKDYPDSIYMELKRSEFETDPRAGRSRCQRRWGRHGRTPAQRPAPSPPT